jgi:ABC-type cobalamin transport system permease subunit
VTGSGSAGSAHTRRRVSPFLAFALVAALAVGGAIWEDSYFTTTPGLSGASLGTTVGIVIAVVVFFLLASLAPAND